VKKWHYSPRKSFTLFSISLSLSLSFFLFFIRAERNAFGFSATSIKTGPPRAIAGKIERDFMIDTLMSTKKVIRLLHNYVRPLLTGISHFPNKTMLPRAKKQARPTKIARGERKNVGRDIVTNIFISITNIARDADNSFSGITTFIVRNSSGKIAEITLRNS